MIGVTGWDEAVRKLSLAKGDLRVDVPGASLLAPSAQPFPPSPRSGVAGITTDAGGPTVPVSSRWLYPGLVSSTFAAGELQSTDFTVALPTSSGPLTGVERAPDSTDPKQVLEPTVALATPTARTFAIVLDDIPARLFDSQAALRALLSNEASRRLSDAVDAHTVSTIEAATPPNGSTGADLVSQIRNAIADHRDLGSSPSLLALTPADAASLDLSVQPSSGDYIFRVDLEGSGSPVWSLVVREVPEISEPTLIDPARLGLLYVGEGSVLVDPYGAGLHHNTVDVRVEVDGRMHVRDVLGAYQVAA